MFELLVLLFFSLLSFFAGLYSFYYALLKSNAKKPWNLKIDHSFQPEISILVPVHNEERNIGQKLSDLTQVAYPRDYFEVIVVDDCSTDKSLSVVADFIGNNQDINFKVIKQYPRAGKSAALNRALQGSLNQIVVVSDADTLWDRDILRRALPYLADPNVGAVTSVGLNINDKESWVTAGEGKYLNVISMMREGESKLHSTIRFEGGFCAYKKEAFDSFDCETGADDSGTALSIVQNGWRTILVPEAVFYTTFPWRLSGKFRIKIRRAVQLIGLWLKCFDLMTKKKLLLPKRIAVPQLLLFTVNPFVMAALFLVGAVTILLYPFTLFSSFIVLGALGLLLFGRRMFLEVLLDNFILIWALVSYSAGKRYVKWDGEEAQPLKDVACS